MPFRRTTESQAQGPRGWLLFLVFVVVAGLMSSPSAAQDDDGDEVIDRIEESLEEQDGQVPPIAIDALLAPVNSDSQAMRLAIKALVWDRTSPNELQVRFPEGFEFPTSDYQIHVNVGNPESVGGERIVVSAAEAGPTAQHEIQEDSGDFTVVGPVVVRYFSSVLTVSVPSFAQPPGNGIWVSIVDGSNPSEIAFSSGIFPVFSLTGRTPGVQTISSFAWINDAEQPPADPTTVTGPTNVRLAEGDIRLSISGRPPADVSGQAVEKVVDLVRITPDFPGGAAADLVIAIDHQLGEINLFDASSGFFVGVEPQEPFVTEGLPTGGVEEPAQLLFDIDAVLTNFGIERDDTAIGMGVGRTVTFEDGTTQRVDGVLATLDWYEFSAGIGAPDFSPAAADDEQAPAAEAEFDNVEGTAAGSGQSATKENLTLTAVVVSAIAIALGIVVFVARWVWRQRRREWMLGPPAQLPPRPAVTIAEQKSIDELNEQLFGPGSGTSVGRDV